MFKFALGLTAGLSIAGGASVFAGSIWDGPPARLKKPIISESPYAYAVAPCITAVQTVYVEKQQPSPHFLPLAPIRPHRKEMQAAR